MGRKKLSEIQEAEIKDYLKKGCMMSKIAKKYRVSVETIERIRDDYSIPRSDRKTIDADTKRLLEEWDKVRIWIMDMAHNQDPVGGNADK